jgi:hypothetical protein
MNLKDIFKDIFLLGLAAIVAAFSCPDQKRYQLKEDPEELGYWLEEIDEPPD